MQGEILTKFPNFGLYSKLSPKDLCQADFLGLAQLAQYSNLDLAKNRLILQNFQFWTDSRYHMTIDYIWPKRLQDKSCDNLRLLVTAPFLGNISKVLNDLFTMASGHFFAKYMNIFQKTVRYHMTIDYLWPKRLRDLSGIRVVTIFVLTAPFLGNLNT